MKHLKKMSKEALEDYREEINPKFGARNRKASISKSPDNSPMGRGFSIKGFAESGRQSPNGRQSPKGRQSPEGRRSPPSRKSSSYSPGIRGMNFNSDMLETSSLGKTQNLR